MVFTADLLRCCPCRSSSFRHRMDHRRYNGAALLGLKGVVVKSHGSADAFAFSHALARAASEVEHGLLGLISNEIGRLHADGLLAPKTADDARAAVDAHP